MGQVNFNRIELSTGHGFNAAPPTYHAEVTGGFSVGIGDPYPYCGEYLKGDRSSFFQIPILLTTGRWTPDAWQAGAMTGVRFDFQVINLDFLTRFGALIAARGDGEHDAGFLFAPTMRIGFIWNIFGLEVSTVAFSELSEAKAGLTYTGAYLNLGGALHAIFSACSNPDCPCTVENTCH